MSCDGGVAHRLEQAAHNHLVVGSIPTTPTTSHRFYQALHFVSMPAAQRQKSCYGCGDQSIHKHSY